MPLSWSAQAALTKYHTLGGLNRRYLFLLPNKVEAKVDTLCLLPQPEEGQQQIQEQKLTSTTRKSNCMEVRQPRS